MTLFAYTVLSTFVFAGIIVFLLGILSLAESKLARKGDCRISINDDHKLLHVPAGQNMLFALSDQHLFLPSACGGGGTCAMCKCQVLAGGGDILPTETGLLTRREQKDHYRLACQVKVRQDMTIHIPEEIFNIKRVTCRVRSNRNVATFIKELVLELPDPMDFQSGQYIQMYIPPYQLQYSQFAMDDIFKDDWGKYGLWDVKAENDEEVFRAYSMANYPAEAGIVKLNIRIASPPPRNLNLPAGIASSYIFNLKEGDQVDISGPYGDFLIKDSGREMIYVGGGAGMAPLRSHLFHLMQTLKTQDRKISFWYGARSVREMFYTEEFRRIEKEYKNFSYHVALSEPLPGDHWEGPTGFIHQVLYDEYLKNHEEPEESEYYLCGPPLMIAAVQKMLDSLGVPEDMIAYDEFG